MGGEQAASPASGGIPIGRLCRAKGAGDDHQDIIMRQVLKLSCASAQSAHLDPAMKSGQLTLCVLDFSVKLPAHRTGLSVNSWTS